MGQVLKYKKLTFQDLTSNTPCSSRYPLLATLGSYTKLELFESYKL
jgi:hypothetical protein